MNIYKYEKHICTFLALYVLSFFVTWMLMFFGICQPFIIFGALSTGLVFVGLISAVMFLKANKLSGRDHKEGMIE